MKYGANITVLAPDFAPEIEQWALDRRATLRRKRYESGDVTGAVIVIAATDDAGINEQIAADARGRGILANVVDETSLCDFIVPAVIESGSIQVAVSTGGQSPALARRLKHDLQQVVGSEYAEVNEILGSLREPAKKSLPADVDRKRFFDQVIALGIVGLLREGRRREAYEAVAGACDAASVPVSDLIRRAIAAAKG
jgi:precorrin-2 dehydrogenase/sirohydrochlorin ferrochelatase